MLAPGAELAQVKPQPLQALRKKLSPRHVPDRFIVIDEVRRTTLNGKKREVPGIVQGHGGITLEHLKALGLHSDLGPGERFFWYTTTGWMMWNFLVSGLPAKELDCQRWV